jgi:hypothetical protein
MLPCYAGQAAKKVNDSVKQFVQPPPPTADKWYVIDEDDDELILSYYLGTF